MAAKQSAEMKRALAIVAGGTSVKLAAQVSNVHWTSIYQSIKASGHSVASLREEYAKSLKKKRK